MPRLRDSQLALWRCAVPDPTFKPRNPWLVIPWTYGLFTLCYMNQYLYYWLGGLLADATFGEMASGRIKTPETVLLRGAIGLIVGLPLALFIVRLLWRRSWDWLGLRFQPRLLAGGLLLGLAAAGLTAGVLALLGVLRVAEIPARLAGSDLAISLVGLSFWILFKSILEELIFRGMATRELAARWNWTAATIVAGIYFGLTHLATVGSGLTPVLAIRIIVASILVSFLFVSLYRRGKSLWLPIGVHAGWNFALSALLGITMSGKDQSFGLFHLELSGNQWLTGGEFGLELSPVALLVYIGLGLACLLIPGGVQQRLLPRLPP